MVRRSQTELAVLGALAVEPATGYGVREAIKNTLGHFWHESFGQIYPTLAELEDAGLVTRTAAGQFAITAEGRNRLADLLAEPPTPARPRNGLLLRVFFAAHMADPADLRQLLEQAREEAAAALSRYETLADEVALEANPEVPNWMATIRYGIRHARATLDWAEETLADHQLGPDPD